MDNEKNKIYEFKFTPIAEQFYNEDSNWGVYRFLTEEKQPYLEEYMFLENKFEGKLVGNMQKLNMNVEYKFKGTLDYNKKFQSYQYKPINISAIRPTTVEQQKKFLLTIITSKQTEILIKEYPNIVNDVLSNKKIDLQKTKGIKETTFQKIQEKIIENFAISDLLVLLSPLGVKINMIKKIYNCNQSIDLLKQQILDNPYVFTKIKGLGFKKVDDFALKINPDIKISKNRVRAYIVYILKQIGSQDGHTWVKKEHLRSYILKDMKECINVFDDIIREEIRKPSFLYVNHDIIGLKHYYDVEKDILQTIKNINKDVVNISEENMSKGINNAEKKQEFNYSEEQVNAIRSINDNNAVIITANAGCGKTTILKGILEVCNDKKVVMCALSAKAAQRIKEVTFFENCMTIHKLLQIDKETGKFLYNKNNKLDYDVVIVDEVSMINIELFYDLIQAIPKNAKLILSFDDAQLPPIGAGNPAKDLLMSNIQINRLTKVYRQAEESGILSDANKIRKNINPLSAPAAHIIDGKLKDMHYRFRESMQDLNDLAIEGFMQSLQKLKLDDIVIIVPRKQGCINSIREINKIIQDKLIPNDVQMLYRGDMKFKLGAKVIQKVNNAEYDVINGEIGYITEIDKVDGKEIFKVNFGENKTVTFRKPALKDMELAYALTCHSCQGSQYKRVIAILDMSHYLLLTNEMLYTMITRAKENCWLLSQPKAFIKSLKTHANRRNTFLKEMLKISKNN